MSENSSVLKIEKFDGTKKRYPVWKSQFSAVCAVKKVQRALSMSFINELPATEAETLNESNDDEKKQIKAREMNALAMQFLALAMEKPKLLRILKEAKSNVWPNGLACEVWRRLQEKYQPSDVIAQAEQASKLMDLKLSKREDPEKLLDEMAMIELEYQVDVEEKQRIAAVVKAAGPQYADAIRLAQSNKGSAVTADDLVEEMCKSWRISGGKSDDDTPRGGDETVLASTNVGNSDKCYNCGEEGHKANGCPKRSNCKCYRCGKQGHKQYNCLHNPNNKHLRPAWFKSIEGVTDVENYTRFKSNGRDESNATNIEMVIASVDASVSEMSLGSAIVTCQDGARATSMKCKDVALKSPMKCKDVALTIPMKCHDGALETLMKCHDGALNSEVMTFQDGERKTSEVVVVSKSVKVGVSDRKSIEEEDEVEASVELEAFEKGGVSQVSLGDSLHASNSEGFVKV